MVEISSAENYAFPLSPSTHNHFTAFTAVVLNPGCMSELPKEFLKISIPNIHAYQTTKSESTF